MTCLKSTSPSTPSDGNKTAALLTNTSVLSLYVETIRTDPRSVMSSGTSVSIPLPRLHHSQLRTRGEGAIASRKTRHATCRNRCARGEDLSARDLYLLRWRGDRRIPPYADDALAALPVRCIKLVVIHFRGPQKMELTKGRRCNRPLIAAGCIDSSCNSV